jgi:hypothetical protein
MKKASVALLLTLAFAGLISAASGAVVTGSQTYSYLDNSDNNWWNQYSSGSSQDLKVSGETVANANVNNWQDLGAGGHTTFENPSVAQQYGSTKLTLNNYQEPGNLVNTIKDFQFESAQGGMEQIKSEGFDWVRSIMVGSASASTNPDADFLLHDVSFVDNNYADAYAVGTDAKIKTAVFNWDAVSAANVVLQDSMTEHADIASGMSVGAYAEGKILPGEDFGQIGTSGWFSQTATILIDGDGWLPPV